MTDVLPPSLTLAGATATSGIATANLGTNTVTWNGSIAAGGSVTITITATIKSGTGGSTVSNQATVAYDSDGNGTNDATGSSDDPGTPAAGDPTSVTVTAPIATIPALSQTGLLALGLALAAVALARVRRRRVA
jgi:hypothetical protein